MIEKIARALCEAHGDDPDALYIDREGKTRDEPNWHTRRDDAKTALRAARDPVVGMAEAARTALRTYILSLTPEERGRRPKDERGIILSPVEKATVRYQAMIDFALAEAVPAPARKAHDLSARIKLFLIRGSGPAPSPEITHER